MFRVERLRVYFRERKKRKAGNGGDMTHNKLKKGLVFWHFT